MGSVVEVLDCSLRSPNPADGRTERVASLGAYPAQLLGAAVGLKRGDAGAVVQQGCIASGE